MPFHDDLAFPKIPNEKLQPGHCGLKRDKLSKVTRKAVIKWDKARLHPSLDQIEAQKALHVAQEKFKGREESLRKEHEVLQEERKDLEIKQNELQNRFRMFNQFVRQNRDKRLRAENMAGENKKVREIWTKYIEKAQENYKNLKQMKVKFDEKIKAYRIYEEFLESVIANSKNDYKNINEIINHYETLYQARAGLVERQERDLSGIENARMEMTNLIEKNTFIIIGLNNDVSSLNSRFIKASSSSHHWENVVSNIKNAISSKLKKIDSIKKASYFIYLTMCKRKGATPEFGEDKFEDHLVYIKKFLKELDIINKTIESEGKAKKATTITERKKSFA